MMQFGGLCSFSLHTLYLGACSSTLELTRQLGFLLVIHHGTLEPKIATLVFVIVQKEMAQ